MSDLPKVRIRLNKWIRGHAADLSHVGRWISEWETKYSKWQGLHDDYSTRWRDLVEQDEISHSENPREHPEVKRMLEEMRDAEERHANIQDDTRDHGISPTVLDRYFAETRDHGISRTELERYFGVFKPEVGALILGAFDLRNDFPRLRGAGDPGFDVMPWAERVVVVDWLVMQRDSVPGLVSAPDSDYPVPEGAYRFDSALPPFRIDNDPYKASTRQNVGLALTNRPEFKEDWPKMVLQAGKLIDKRGQTGKPPDTGDDGDKLDLVLGNNNYLPPRAQKAWDLYQIGVETLNKPKARDYEVYKHLASIKDLLLPKRVTWVRNLREARRIMGQQKNSPRHPSRIADSGSVVPKDQI